MRPPPACLRPHRGLVVGAGPTLPAGLPLGGAARAARPLHRGLVLGGAAARPAARSLLVGARAGLGAARSAARAAAAPRPRPLSTPARAPPSALAGASRADLVRYATYAAAGAGVYVVASGVMSAVSSIMHVNPATMAKYGFYAGFLTAAVVFAALVAGYRAIHIRPEPAYRAALDLIRKSYAADATLGGNVRAGGLRAYTLDGGNVFPSPSAALGVEWKPPRVMMLFSVHGDKHDGVASLEALKRLDGSFDFTYVGVDVCNKHEDRLLVHGSEGRMTEKKDKLRELITFKNEHHRAYDY